MKRLLLTTGIVCLFATLHAQNVGIGQSSPVSKLDIAGGLTIGSGYSGTNTAPANGLLVEGNTGIGYTSPEGKLHVSGTIIAGGRTAATHGSLNASEVFRVPGSTSDYIVAVQDGNGRIQHKWNATYGTGETYLVSSENAWFWDVTVSGDPYMEFKFASPGTAGNTISWNTHMAFKSDGNIGIGTSSPNNKLDVNGTVEMTGIKITSSPVSGYVLVSDASGTGTWTNPSNLNDNDWIFNGSHLYNGNSGNIGIGITNPSQKLHVVGNVLVSNGSYITGDARNVRILGGNTADDASYEWLGFYSGTTRQGIILYDGAWGGANNLANEFSITAENSNHMSLNTPSSRHIMMMPGGNVGINTTSPSRQLEVYSSSSTYPARVGGASGYLDFGPGNTSWSHFITDRPRFYFNTGLSVAGGQVSAYSSSDLYLQTNSTTRMTIDYSTGHVGVNTTTPDYRFEAYNNAAIGTSTVIGGTNAGSSGVATAGQITNSSSGWAAVEGNTISTTGSGVKGLNLATSGGGIGVYGVTNAPSTGWAGYFAGDVYCTGFYYGSDKRFKKNAEQLSEYRVLDKLMQLEPTAYEYDTEQFPGMGFTPGKKYFGLMAQDLEKIFPNLVTNSKSIVNAREPATAMSGNISEDGYYLVDYVSMIPVLVQAIKEQQETIESLKMKMADMEDINKNKK